MADPGMSWAAYPWAKPGQRRALAGLVMPLAGKAALALADRFDSNVYRPGTVLFYRSHLPLACYLLSHGSVVLEFGHGNRAARGIMVEGPAMLGHWHALKGQAYPVTARAVTPAVVALIPRRESGQIKLPRTGDAPLAIPVGRVLE